MAVASAAFHNSAQRLDPPKCHANTREAVLRSIMDWITNDAKPADVDPLAERRRGGRQVGDRAVHCGAVRADGCPARKLFLFRTDSTRNKIKPLVATLAYQLALNVPGAREAISSAIEHDPLIFDRSFESQFTSLIMDPFSQTRILRPPMRIHHDVL